MIRKYSILLVIFTVVASTARAVTYECRGVDFVQNQILLKLYPSAGGQHDMQVTMRPGGTLVLKNVEFSEKVEGLTPAQIKGLAQFITDYELPYRPQDIGYGQFLAFKREGAGAFGITRYFDRRKKFAFATGFGGFSPFPCSK